MKTLKVFEPVMRCPVAECAMPKVHYARHWSTFIAALGPPDGYLTEMFEMGHKDS